MERLANLMRAELRKAGSDESLQPVHLHAMIYLAKANRYSNTPQALTAYLGLTKGTVSQTLLVLDRRGLIERYQDDVDRRVVRLRLSTSGEQLLYEAQPALAWQNATRTISPNRIRNATDGEFDRERTGDTQPDNFWNSEPKRPAPAEANSATLWLVGQEERGGADARAYELEFTN